MAVACGMLPFADGSDLGGSLRNPGNYCNVVGFRPTPGRDGFLDGSVLRNRRHSVTVDDGLLELPHRGVALVLD